LLKATAIDVVAVAADDMSVNVDHHDHVADRTVLFSAGSSV
jgi:hypothetical protein